MRKKKLIITVSLASVFFVSLASFGYVYFSFLHRYKGKDIVNNWSKDDSFDISKIATVNKDKNKEFIILNLADIQLSDEDIFLRNPKTKKEMDYLVSEVKPDLITLTGDQTWSNENLHSIKKIIKWLDGYRIPFAPVFGNHDYGNQKDSAVASQRYLCDLYENSKYSLFSRGPTNIDSLGNYVINIKEDSSIYRTIYMVDAGYEDKINNKQIEFFNWNKEGIKANNNGIIPKSLAFMHKPIPEYIDAYHAYKNNVPGVIAEGEVYRHYSLSGTEQNGFFEFAKSSNIEHIIAGHQHGNSFSIRYNDIWLTSSLKTGELGGTIDNEDVYLNGATVFRLNNDETKIERVFIQKGQF